MEDRRGAHVSAENCVKLGGGKQRRDSGLLRPPCSIAVKPDAVILLAVHREGSEVLNMVIVGHQFKANEAAGCLIHAAVLATLECTIVECDDHAANHCPNEAA